MRLTIATLILVALALFARPASAVVIVTDNGLTVPTGFETGYTGATNTRTSVDVAESHGQSFTLGSAITLGSIFVGYNDAHDVDPPEIGNFTITVDVDNNGSADLTEVIQLTSTDFTAGGGNDGPFYWMEWDLSSNNLGLSAAQHSFSIEYTSNVSGSVNPYFFATRKASNGSYAGGGGLGDTGGFDLAFAISAAAAPAPAPVTVPEPSTFVLVTLGLLGLASVRRRRRRVW